MSECDERQIDSLTASFREGPDKLSIAIYNYITRIVVYGENTEISRKSVSDCIAKFLVLMIDAENLALGGDGALKANSPFHRGSYDVIDSKRSPYNCTSAALAEACRILKHRTESRVDLRAGRQATQAPDMSDDNSKEISDTLVWIDIETTGIEDRDIILEIAAIVTNNDLKELGAFSSLVGSCDPRTLIRASTSTVSSCKVFPPKIPCWDQHFDSGLIAEMVQAAEYPNPVTGKLVDNLPSLQQVESAILGFLELHGATGEPRSPMCGSSIHFDRRFLRRYMPNLIKALHYRNIDASAIRNCAYRFSPALPMPPKRSPHRALADLRNSIDLLRYFRKTGFLGV